MQKPLREGFRGALFAAGAVGIAYQLALMRIFSIAHWHHFAYMMISIAMLGFGAAGTALTFMEKALRNAEGKWFARCSVLLAVSMVVCHEMAAAVPFETFHVFTQPEQLRHLFLLYLILALPFFFVSCMMTLAFQMDPGSVAKTYFVNLTGSGAGAVLLVALLFILPPGLLPYVLAVPMASVAVYLSRRLGSMEKTIAYILMGGLSVWVAVRGPVPVQVSQYKALSYAMQLPDAEVVARSSSPLSSITAVSSSLLRETPGQLSGYPMGQLGGIPPQIGLYFDGGGVSVINRFHGDLNEFAYLGYVTSALGYRLVESPEVLVIGAGGGTDVLMALHHGASHVTAVEVDPGVFPLMEGPFREFSGNLYGRSDVTTVLADGRGFLQGSGKRYHLIQIALLDSFNAAAAGVYALSESYLYTLEAMDLYLSRLAPGGVLSVTRWLKTPPRDAIRMFAVMAEALRSRGVERPGDHMAMIRSWNTATIIASPEPLTPRAVDSIMAFAGSRGFDLCWYPGITEEQTNRFVLLDEPYYYNAAKAIVTEERESFFRRYIFNVSPPTDDRPHFFQFFKWDTLEMLTREMGLEWIPFMEWGYVILVLTIAQSALASVLLILLPLVALRRGGGSRGKGWVVLYFSCLGLAFMFLEIGFMQKFMLFLSYPLYAVAVVLTGLLVFSGLGSLAAGRWKGRGAVLAARAVAGIALVTLVYSLALPWFFRAAAHWPTSARIASGLALLFPPAFLMGIPFPAGMQLVSSRHSRLVPWAWGINGFAGVMGASLATFTAIHLGFRFIMIVSILLYTAAALCLTALEGRRMK